MTKNRGTMTYLELFARIALICQGKPESEDTGLLRRNNELLTILIAELRDKNTSANVTVAGDPYAYYGGLVGFYAGSRR